MSLIYKVTTYPQHLAVQLDVKYTHPQCNTTFLTTSLCNQKKIQ